MKKAASSAQLTKQPEQQAAPSGMGYCGLFDVDHTLFVKDQFNEDLAKACAVNGITHAFLFTDMVLDLAQQPDLITHRLQAISELRDHGIYAYKVITPLDITWVIPDHEITQLSKIIIPFLNNPGHKIENLLTDQSRATDDKTILERLKEASPAFSQLLNWDRLDQAQKIQLLPKETIGSAFHCATQVFNKTNHADEHRFFSSTTERSHIYKILTDLIACNLQLNFRQAQEITAKTLMFELFALHHMGSIGFCCYFEDKVLHRKAVLQSHSKIQRDCFPLTCLDPHTTSAAKKIERKKTFAELKSELAGSLGEFERQTLNRFNGTALNNSRAFTQLLNARPRDMLQLATIINDSKRTEIAFEPAVQRIAQLFRSCASSELQCAIAMIDNPQLLQMPHTLVHSWFRTFIKLIWRSQLLSDPQKKDACQNLSRHYLTQFPCNIINTIVFIKRNGINLPIISSILINSFPEIEKADLFTHYCQQLCLLRHFINRPNARISNPQLWLELDQTLTQHVIIKCLKIINSILPNPVGAARFSFGSHKQKDDVGQFGTRIGEAISQLAIKATAAQEAACQLLNEAITKFSQQPMHDAVIITVEKLLAIIKATDPMQSEVLHKSGR